MIKITLLGHKSCFCHLYRMVVGKG